jgi:hypothetical protein
MICGVQVGSNQSATDHHPKRKRENNLASRITALFSLVRGAVHHAFLVTVVGVFHGGLRQSARFLRAAQIVQNPLVFRTV